MNVTRILIAAAAVFTLAVPTAMADECGSESISGQSGPDLVGAGSHVRMLLSQFNDDNGSAGDFEKHNLYDFSSSGAITVNGSPFSGQAVRGAALASAGDRYAASWWSATGAQRALGGAGDAPATFGAPVSLAGAEVSDSSDNRTDVAINAAGNGAVIDVNGRVHRLAPDGTLGPAVDANNPTHLVVNPDGTIWFAGTSAAKPNLMRWVIGAPVPVAVPVAVPFGFSYDFDAVADGDGGVRLLSRAASGAGFVHVRADGSVVTKKFAFKNAQLKTRLDGSFAITSLRKAKGLRTLAYTAGKADDSLAKPVVLYKGRTALYSYDAGLQAGTNALVTFDLDQGNGSLRVMRVKGKKHTRPFTIKPKTPRKSGFGSPQIATTTSGGAWMLFTAFDRYSYDSACGEYTNFRYVVAQVSANGQPKKPKALDGAHPLYYYVGG